jgi:leucyl aminopeptidase (aminopeptidase T)
MFRNLNASNVLLALVFAGILATALLAGPRYMDHADVKKAVKVAHLNAAKKSDAQLLRLLREETQDMGLTHTVTDESGEEQEKPGLSEEQVEIFRDAYSSSVRVTVTLPCNVELLGWVQEYDCGASKEGVPGEE